MELQRKDVNHDFEKYDAIRKVHIGDIYRDLGIQSIYIRSTFEAKDISIVDKAII